ncbi:MAG TPA: hypothetical protein ENK23_05480 [Sorangium sp.]|nr:hypothetical protein [Sorangium sp.]
MPEPAELEYFPEKQKAHSSVEAWVPIGAAVLVWVLLSVMFPGWALPLAIGIAAGWWQWRRTRRQRPHMTFTIQNGRLLVVDRHEHVVFECALEELDDVMLDTKTIQRVKEDMSSGIPMTQFVSSSVGPSIDTSRIELVSDKKVVRLTEHYTSNIDATEWFSKIRRFLRRHGWIPLLERSEQ